MFVRMANDLEDEQNSGREQVLKEASIEFGRRVKELRKAAGLTQAELAERLGRWGKSYHQTTVAKLEAGTRPTNLDELMPLAVALGVSQREFFDDPSPADRAEHKVREAEQDLLEIHSELMSAFARVKQLQNELQKRVHLYSRRVAALAEFDPEAAAERRQAVQELTGMIDSLGELSPEAVAERQQAADDLKDLADTLRTDQWPEG